MCKMGILTVPIPEDTSKKKEANSKELEPQMVLGG